ncbi:unnamed protein product [Ascophyllum nodosum]
MPKMVVKGQRDELPGLQGEGLELHHADLLQQYIHTAGYPVRPLQYDQLRRPHQRHQRGT